MMKVVMEMIVKMLVTAPSCIQYFVMNVTITVLSV